MKKLLRSNRINLLHDASLHRGDTFTEKLRIAFWIVVFCLMSIGQSVAQLSGTVFTDYNANGIRTTSNPAEPLMSGIIVTAYNSAGTILASYTSTSASAPNYSIPASGSAYNGTLGSNTGFVASGTAVRLEFTNIPSGYYTSPNGTTNGSSVQFKTAGVSVIADFSINYPDDYCEANPLVITPCYINGSQTSNSDVLVGVNFDATGGVQHIALSNQIGSTWGIAYQKNTKTLFAAAVLKRHTGFGKGTDNTLNTADDISSIYVFNNYTGTGAGTVSAVINLNSFAGVNVGANPRLGTTPANDLGGAGSPNHDYGVFGNEGKIGIGDIDISEDGKTLYALNLNQKQLVLLDVSNPNAPTLIGAYTIPSPIGAPSGDTFRPWGIGLNQGKVYVGGVMTADVSQNRANLRAYVLEFNGSSFSTVDIDGNSANDYLPLNYDRTTTYYEAPNDIAAEWQPWSDDVNVIFSASGSRPRPILADIDFTGNGSMVLSFIDRTGMQMGWNNYQPNSANTTLYQYASGGDLRQLCNIGSFVNPVYAPEGTSGCTQNYLPPAYMDADPANLVIPRFYNTSSPYRLVANGAGPVAGHGENPFGGLAVHKPTNSLVYTAMNPIDLTLTSGGLRWLNTTTGSTIINNYQLYRSNEPLGNLAKAVGLGDAEILCNSAPIEIGNRIWKDTDQDGIQDAGEVGIDGVLIELYEGTVATGTPVQTVTSATVNGQPGSWYFTNLKANQDYVIKVKTALGAGALTNCTAFSPTGAGTVLIDNNTSTGTISLKTGNAGENNHSFDIGVTTQPFVQGPIFCGMLIDSLTTVQNSLTNGRVSSVQSSSILLGGERDMNFITNAPTSSTTTLFEVGPYFSGGNALDIQNQSAASSTLTIQWDGLDGDAVNLNPTGLGGLNFAALGINRLKAQLNADFPPNTNDSLQIRLELYTNAGAASRITKNFKFTSSTFNAIEFKFSDLVPFVGSGVDLSNIGAVVMFIDMSPNTVSTRTGWDVLLKDLTLECCTKPVASATPRTQTICVGSAATAYTATPSTGVEYKWFGPLADTTSNLGTAVSGATSATFTPSGAVLTTAGVKYYAVVVNTTGDVNCADTAFVRLVVNTKPVIADGSATICAGESVDLTSKITSYNTYLSPVWTIGTANGTVVTTPSSVKPTGTTTYVLVAQNAAGCKDTANVVVTVNAKPNAGKDTTLACVNAATNTLATSYTLVPSPAGGSWSQLGTTPATATITGNNVTGMSVTGTYQFIYTTTAGCKDTVAVTVAPCAGCVKPNAGPDAANVCQPIKTAKLMAVTTGGTWAPIVSPANPSAATIDASGNISGLNAAGTYKFVYSVTSGGQTCTDTAQVIVLAKPVIADGSATICAGESVDLTSKITNYNTYLSPVWTVATASGTAVTTPSSVKPTGTTTYVLVAQNAAGCKDTANVVVTVNAKPSAGVDQTICAGSNATLTGTANTGTWTAQSNNPAGATLGTTASGVASVAFTSSAAGAYNFIYNIGTCSDTVKITVNSCEASCADQVMAFSGRYNYTVIGNVENSGELAGPGQCMDAGSSSRTLTIPAGSTVKAAYLYWSGSANNTNGNVNVDNSVTLNGTTVNATRTWTRTLNLPPRLDFYGAFAEVTSLVTAGGVFTLTNLDWDNAGTECDFAAAYGGWSMVVVFENSSLPPSEITLYDTFDGVFSSNEFDQTTKLCNLNLSPCIKSSELTIISWEGDSYKGETTFINGVNQGDNLLNGQNSFDGTSNFNLDIDKFNLSSIVNASTNEINYRVNSYNVFYNGSFAREFHITNALVFKYIKDDPTVTVADVSVCTGETATLTATGCTGGTISWNNGTTGTTLTVTNVVANQSFTATCTINGCTASDAGTIIVKAKPTLSATPVCDASGTTYRVDFSATGTVTASAGTVSGSSVVNIPVGTSVTIRAILDGCKDSTIVISPSCSVPKGSLGDFVWKDTNNNGIQDETTPNGGGVAGVQVELYKVGITAAIAKDTTEATGKYLFTNLDAGQYYIKVVAASIPAGCAISAMKDVSTGGGTEANDSDVDPTTGQSGNYVIDPFDPTKKDILTVDAALYSPCIKPNAGPDAANVCQPIKTAKLTVVTAGGTWAPIVSPANPSAATIDASGNISGLNAAGAYKFVYSVTSGGQTCTDTAQVVVLAKPVIADGSATICAGESVDLTSKITNYNTYLSPVWTIGTANGTAVATPNSVKPTGTTTYVLVAQNAAGCKDTANVVVTVNAKPSAGKDTTLVCSNGNVPSSVQLSATPTGGTWSALTGNPTGATVSSSGLVSITNATAQGKSFNFVYSVNGCQDTVKVIVPTCPAPCIKSSISSAAPVCSNDAQTYSFTFTIANKLGIVKVNKGTLSGNNPYTVTGIPSGQNVIITDSLSAICKTDTTIAGVNCNCNPALPQLLTPSLTACIGDTFPTLKATVVGLATVEWFSQQTGGTVLATGLSFKPSGTVTANTVFYAQARSTDPTCPTAVSTSRVPATINAQTCIDTIDLALKKSINTKIARVGDVLTYTIKVWNEWTKNATGVEVTDSIATTVQFVSGSFVASRGSATISGNVIKWNIGSIAADGDTVTLRYQVRATQAGIHLNTAEISKTNEKDKDSTPGNGKGGEDDIDQECFTVPFELCAGQKLEVSVPSTLTNVQWFKNGGTTSVATGNVVLFSEVGVYTFTATNQTCPANGCCPVIIEAGTNCCPVDLCIPYTVKKVKK